MGFWISRAALTLAGVLALGAATGAGWQAISEARDRRDFPPPGRLVDIGGRRLHLYCTGRANGRPTVVLESGSDSPSPAWARVQTEVSGAARVCSYDRAGIGWSDGASGPRDAGHIAADLRRLLATAGEAPPYVLVGHSSGGLYVQAFQRLYPDTVAGLVLLDATHEDFFSRTVEGQSQRRQLLGTYQVVQVLARLGVVRLSPVCQLPAGFPTRPATAFHALCSASSPWPAQAAEFRDLTAPLPTPAVDRLTLPLAVVSAGDNVRNVKPWGALQDRLAARSTDSVHIVLAHANHSSLLLDATDAHASSAAILAVLSAAASGRRLTDPPG